MPPYLLIVTGPINIYLQSLTSHRQAMDGTLLRYPRVFAGDFT